ncbi:hypothetical protein Leryth_018506 [Lithospermum erythrorhizon]|nr:hypothetical protein Leryth_018506 [Lithospermum erythrorhizon]
MALSITLKPLQELHHQLLSLTNCKSSCLNTFNFHFTPSLLSNSNTRKNVLCVNSTHLEKMSSLPKNIISRNVLNYETNCKNGSGLSSNRLKDRIFIENSLNNDVNVENVEKKVILKDRYAKSKLNSLNRYEKSDSRGGNLARNRGRSRGLEGDNERKVEQLKNGGGGRVVGGEGMEKGSKKSMAEAPGNMLRAGLDMCSKKGDVMGAIRLYDLARSEGVKMGQYHFGVLLYLCSSAATGVVQPARSGSRARSLNLVDGDKESLGDRMDNVQESGSIESTTVRNESSVLVMTGNKVHTRKSDGELNMNGSLSKVFEEAKGLELRVVKDHTEFSDGAGEDYSQSLETLVQLMKSKRNSSNTKDVGNVQGNHGIEISEDVKRYALERGLEIYENMRLENVPMNEATLTSVARMAMSLGDGDTAFNMVNQMKELGINPRLRSYGPALSVFCGNGNVEKAFLVEEHMLEHGVYPEEPELAALLRVSIEAGRGDKVYYLLHKLRTSVRQVSPSTADAIETWFKSKAASKVGKKKWKQSIIMEAIANGGGGWHGQGWLGQGKWTVSRSYVGSDGFCKCCGEKLVTIDLDPVETENFANSVASIAEQREKNSSFQKFKKWLDYYGPFEAVVDGANVGIYSQRRFRPSKVNAVVNGIRQMLPSKKWPLIILHNRRITGDKMDEPMNKNLIDKWKTADAIYATPTGSNDDWYWLYAAIKCKCLLVTNDEMRDHLFQLLGNDFFPKWKERHQVRFSFSETGPVFHMPPPCSVVIQESEKGHWHIPVVSELESEEERSWLCITRAHTPVKTRESNTSRRKKEISDSSSQNEVTETPSEEHSEKDDKKRETKKIYQDLKSIVLPSMYSDHPTILQELKTAEELGSCVIDFQI